MSIVGLGIDIIEVIRIKKIFYNYGNKFAKRILSETEWKAYMLNKNKIMFLAKTFSTKEAASKALGIGIQYGVFFNQLELYQNELGKPKLRFFRQALKRSKTIKCRYVHVSISDQQLYACSLVILES